MALLAASHPQRFGLIGSLRIVLRIVAIVAALMGCLPLYYIWHLLRLPNPWPRVFLWSVVWFTGVELTITGERPHGNSFLIANHVSWIDIPAIAAACGSAFVGHDGLSAIPLIKHLCAMNDTVFIARHDRASIAAQIEAVRLAVHDTGALTIFPEGTTSDGTGLLPFKSSLLSALEPLPDGVRVIPVLLDYGAEAAKIAWVGTEHGVTNFLRILARGRAVSLTVHFLPALQGEALTDRKTMASSARSALMAAMV